MPESLHGLFGFGAQVGVEHYIVAPLPPAVEQSPMRNAHREHLLETYGLSADLHFVTPVGLRLPALVLDGKDRPDPRKASDRNCLGRLGS